MNMGYRQLVAWALPLALFLALPSAGAAAPSCAEGPETVGTTVIGTPCADTIRLPRGVTSAFGEGGDDRLFGQRGNESLFGGEGADRLYGGIGDDRLRGGPGDDRLFGGFGADSLDGEGGNDLARGDATIDALGDSGGGADTLSFATGATPGFPNAGAFFTDAGFPAGAEGRGVYVDLGDDFANNGLAPSGGGVDAPLEPATDFSDFETVIGTPFPDYIVGTAAAETFHGGGGADLIDGNGGGDVARGGADGDGCVEVAVEDCELDSEDIDLRDPGAIAVGVMAPDSTSAGPALYLTGSDEDDQVTASYVPGVVTFSLAAGSEGRFETGAGGGCAAPTGSTVTCAVAEAPDSILLAGLEGEDVLLTPGFPETVAVVLLGNQGGDALTGGETEDMLIDGAGDDTVAGGGSRRRAAEQRRRRPAQCRSRRGPLHLQRRLRRRRPRRRPRRRQRQLGQLRHRGDDRPGPPAGAGLVGPQGEPRCASAAQLTTLQEIEDVEGTKEADNLLGDAGPNQLLGRAGADNYFAAAGNDHLLANSGDSDPIVDCGEGFDTALIDFAATHADGPPVGCESVEERAPEQLPPARHAARLRSRHRRSQPGSRPRHRPATARRLRPACAGAPRRCSSPRPRAAASPSPSAPPSRELASAAASTGSRSAPAAPPAPTSSPPAATASASSRSTPPATATARRSCSASAFARPH